MLMNCTVLFWGGFSSRAAQEGDNTQFKALEVLVLDDNKLSSGVFNSLKNLKRSSCGLKFAIQNKVLLKADLQCIKKNLWKCSLSIFNCQFQAKAFKPAGEPHF